MDGLIAVERMMIQTDNVLCYRQIFFRYCQSHFAISYCLRQIIYDWFLSRWRRWLSYLSHILHIPQCLRLSLRSKWYTCPGHRDSYILLWIAFLLCLSFLSRSISFIAFLTSSFETQILHFKVMNSAICL